MTDFVLKMIEKAVNEVLSEESTRVDKYISDEKFDKITAYRCGDRVIRVDLHLKEGR